MDGSGVSAPLPSPEVRLNPLRSVPSSVPTSEPRFQSRPSHAAGPQSGLQSGSVAPSCPSMGKLKEFLVYGTAKPPVPLKSRPTEPEAQPQPLDLSALPPPQALVSHPGQRLIEASSAATTEEDQVTSRVSAETESTAPSVSAPPSLSSSRPSQDTQTPDVFDQIRQLGDLMHAGLITAEEFQAKKTDLLSRL
jgi:hypothetical protein